MTQAKAATVATAIINAGFDAIAHQKADGTWVVRATAADLTVDVATASTLATNQGVTGRISEIEYA